MDAHHHGHGREPDMLSVEEALARLLSHFHVLEPEEKPILEVLGQTLAEDVVATFCNPPLDNSAMDGYAVRSQDIAGVSPAMPRVLRVIGQVAAGHLPGQEVLPGTAVRIMTGAPIPPGADTVVPFEETDEVRRKTSERPLVEIGVEKALPAGANVRSAGEDVAKGELVLRAGTALRPAEIGVLASLGRARVRVIRRPVVAILATGDELLAPGDPPVPGRIYDANSYSVSASVERSGGIPFPLGIARDDWEDLGQKIDQAMRADLLITSAGVSKGDYDLVKEVLRQRGEIAFWSVRMRPAKPLAFGLLRGPGGKAVPHVGLPGNPVSALVAFEELCRPALLKMQGCPVSPRPTVEAILEEPIHNADGRRVYARVVVTRRGGRYYARLTGPQGSNLLTSLARANGLAICPEDVEELKAGQVAKVRMLDWPEEVELT